MAIVNPTTRRRELPPSKSIFLPNYEKNQYFSYNNSYSGTFEKDIPMA